MSISPKQIFRVIANEHVLRNHGCQTILNDKGGNTYGKARTGEIWLGLIRRTRDGKQHRHIGTVTGAVYETRRAQTDHFYRKYSGWAISKFLVDHAGDFAFRYVRFRFDESHGYITVEKLRKVGKEIPREGGFEEQLLIDPKELHTACPLLNADIHAIADDLRGTTGSLEETLDEITGIEVDDIALESLGELDELIFQCEKCSWYCEIGEMSESEESVCDECAADE